MGSATDAQSGSHASVVLPDNNSRGRYAVEKIPTVLAVLAGLVTILLTYAIFSSVHLIQADLSTYLLPAQARELGFGSIYVDIFDIKPPLAYAIFVPWISAVGIHLAGFWLLYAVLLTCTLACFWILIRQFLAPWFAFFLFASCLGTIIGLGMLEELFFTTEVVCLALSLGGLLLAYRWRTSLWAFFGAAAMLTAAGQVKEVFILAPIALLPLLISGGGRRRGRVIGAVLGVAFTVVLTVLVLIWWGGGAFAGYLEILRFKREKFPAPGLSEIIQDLGDYAVEISRWLPLLLIFLLALAALVILRRFTNMLVNMKVGNRTEFTSAGLLFFALLLGSLWQGAPLVLHYALGLIFSLYLFLAALLGWALAVTREAKPRIRWIVVGLLLVGLIPSISSVSWVYGRVTTFEPGALLSSYEELESPSDLAVFRKVEELTSPSECIQAAYGWSATANYLYSERRSCTRFVVPPLALDAAYRSAMQQDLIANPPSVIVADRKLADQTALPLSAGTPEAVIFPYEAVLEGCYEGVTGWPTLYVPLSKDPAATGACIQGQVDRIISN